MNEVIEHIRLLFNDKARIQEKRPGIFQLMLPIFHEDGDMIDIFVQSNGPGDILISDFGMTIMRLSYHYDIDTQNKENILQRILSENYAYEENGHIKFHSSLETIYTDLIHMAQVYAKVGSMRYFKREVIESLFYEILEEFIQKNLQQFNPRIKVTPIAERKELEVDFEFRPNGYPVYLYGIKDVTKARLVTISCLEFMRSHLTFKSYVVHENFDALSKKDRALLTNACDKQFTSLDDFKEHAMQFFERERH